MTARRCVVSGADAKLGTAHVIDLSLEIPGWGFFCHPHQIKTK